MVERGSMKQKGITRKLILSILTSCSLLFLVIFSYNYVVSRRIVTEEIAKNAKNLARVTVNKIETVLRSVEKIPSNIAYFLEQSDYRKKSLLELLKSVVQNNPEIYGATVAFEPHSYEKEQKYFAPYFYKDKGNIKFTYLGNDSYRYFYWDWYQIPKELGKAVWSEPYFDEGGAKIVMSTYSVPFYQMKDGKKTFMGVVTADISLTWLQKMVSSIKIANSGYAFLISQNGTFITHPNKYFVMNETIFSIAEERNIPQIRSRGRSMVNGESGFIPFTSVITHKKGWMAYEPLGSTGWSLGVLFPKKELMAKVTTLSTTVLVIGIIGFVLLLLIIIIISRSITRPLRLLAETTKDIARGNLDFTPPDITTKDEVGMLSSSFIVMRDALKQYIKDLTETTKAKERMESELRVAHDIQMSILPKKFPPFPDRKDFDIYAVLEPAREVGGDLFDLFLIDETHICFVVGDVSGKGVPAALFMTETKMLLKAIAHDLKAPDKILSRVNSEIAANNDACLFVTLFCGVLDTRTGIITYANAGHNPPLHMSKKGIKILPDAKNTVLGVLEIEYEHSTLTLAPGDTLFLYTDGVTEAFDSQQECFGEDRLEAALHDVSSESIKDIVLAALAHVKEYAKGVPQSDDITIMAVKFFGSTPNDA